MQGLSILLIGMRIAGHDRSISLYSGEKNLWSTWTKNTETELPTNKFLHSFLMSLSACGAAARMGKSDDEIVAATMKARTTFFCLGKCIQSLVSFFGGIFGSKHFHDLPWFVCQHVLQSMELQCKESVLSFATPSMTQHDTKNALPETSGIGSNHLVTNFENMTRCAVSNRKVPGNFRFIQLGRNRHPIATWKPPQLKFAQSSKSSKAFHSRECLVSNPIFRKFPGSFVWHF